MIFPDAQISKRTERAFSKPCPKVTKVSLIAIELKSSHGTFSSIAIELKIDGQRALRLDDSLISFNGFWLQAELGENPVSSEKLT